MSVFFVAVDDIQVACYKILNALTAWEQVEERLLRGMLIKYFFSSIVSLSFFHMRRAYDHSFAASVMPITS